METSGEWQSVAAWLDGGFRIQQCNQSVDSGIWCWHKASCLHARDACGLFRIVDKESQVGMRHLFVSSKTIVDKKLNHYTCALISQNEKCTQKVIQQLIYPSTEWFLLKKMISLLFYIFSFSPKIERTHLSEEFQLELIKIPQILGVTPFTIYVWYDNSHQEKDFCTQSFLLKLVLLKNWYVSFSYSSFS